MVSLSKSYDPATIEAFWRDEWSARGYFRMGCDCRRSKSFCILLPPPNVTGTLHMGHGFNQTLMDILIRYHYLCGYNTLWQPGTDHAGIATQIVVERQLAIEGKTRHDLGRECFLDRVWDWKSKSGGKITTQMRRLGVSCDWSRESFTLDSALSRNVTAVFVRLYRDGLIYRGKKIINWDPLLKTAVSDLEVVNTEEDGFLWYISYRAVDGNGCLIVATTRPETLFGDVAVAVHPDDDRYKSWIGKHVFVPICNRSIPVIADDSVDPLFGTGCVKVTPASDFDDYKRAIRYSLSFLTIFDDECRLVGEIPESYRGLDRYDARKILLQELKDTGFLVDQKPHRLVLPRGDRTSVVLEPRITDQWFVDLTSITQCNGLPGGWKSLVEPALDLCKRKEITFVPDVWYNTYYRWLSEIQDWCISRQLWWGHRIPAWFSDDGSVWVAHDEDEAYQLARKDGYVGTLIQDSDVLDTWFSSALWPFSSLGWTPEYPDVSNPAMDLYLPSSVLVTGFDIIFFWVARMIMITNYITGKVPFRTVYVHGLIRDGEGQKMSKSKGNVLDPIDLIDGISLEELLKKRTFALMNPSKESDIVERTLREFPNGIQAYGVDALRFTFSSLASPGRDIKFDLDRCAGYRNFCNKLWNAARFVLMNVDGKLVRCDFSYSSWVDKWILSVLNRTVDTVHKSFQQYRFDWAAQAIHSFFWDEYCDWYIEMSKVQLADSRSEVVSHTSYVLCLVLDIGLRLAHPIIPFLTEELWKNVSPLIHMRSFPSILELGYPKYDHSCNDETAEGVMASFKKMVAAIRHLRSEMKVSPSHKVSLIVERKGFWPYDSRYLRQLAKVSDISFTDNMDSVFAPKGQVDGLTIALDVSIDHANEEKRLEKEHNKIMANCQLIREKLAQPSFCDKAPANVVNRQKQMLKENEEKLMSIEKQLKKIRQWLLELDSNQRPTD
ncbi:valyl-tRNA synthase [Candidatus Ichthyocystis hellenicum]|uniref:Valine--tRNA ligase n=1 Tax=Candidatus Ichthyocystis hellenicum TaxID=1561003 RepID=A0A0S4M5B4_9BURK|nr:valyl-tRNA synthase [Candidatus Ichthyocystis hellenicum]